MPHGGHGCTGTKVKKVRLNPRDLAAHDYVVGMETTQSALIDRVFVDEQDADLSGIEQPGLFEIDE